MKNKCEKYGMAITNYVLGEDLRMPAEELFAHLRVCQKCRDELVDWRETYAVMRTEAYYKKPKAQKKFQELLEKIKNLPAPTLRQAGQPVTRPTRTVLDASSEINSAAKDIYKFGKGYTGGNPEIKVPIPVIRKKTYYKGYPFYEAMGTLVRDKKANYTKDKDNQPTHASFK